MIRLFEVLGRKFPAWAVFAYAIVSPSSSALRAQDFSPSPTSAPGNVKCWEAPASIIVEAGVAADSTQGYFAESSGRLFAVELASGEVLWVTEIGGNVRSEIVVSKGKVFIVTSESADGKPTRSVLRTLNTSTGLSAWNLELPASEKYFIEPTDQGVLAISTDGNVFHLAKADGTILWRSSTRGTIAIAPRLNNGRLLIATEAKTVEEFDVTDVRRIASGKVNATPAYVGAGNNSTAVFSDPKGGVYSIKTDGSKNWKFRSGGRIVFIEPVDGNVLFGSADNFVYFMSVESGNLAWKRRLPGRIANGGLISPSSAIFTVIGERSAYVIELNKGRLVDQISVTGEDAFLLTPVRANGKYLLAATQKGLSAFSDDCENEKSGD